MGCEGGWQGRRVVALTRMGHAAGPSGGVAGWRVAKWLWWECWQVECWLRCRHKDRKAEPRLWTKGSRPRSCTPGRHSVRPLPLWQIHVHHSQPPCNVLTKRTSSPASSTHAPSPSSSQSASLTSTRMPGRTAPSRTKSSRRAGAAAARNVAVRCVTSVAIVGGGAVEVSGRDTVCERWLWKRDSRPPLLKKGQLRSGRWRWS